MVQPKQGSTLPYVVLKIGAYSMTLDTDIVELKIQNWINLTRHTI